ncbi:MAG TPA: hypothetical protein VMU69_00115 [Bradyrhizobium sp.]|nr:hypothetical protein [Bradyrhizobium sp.]
MAASFVMALAIVIAFRLGASPGERVSGALRATARWSFTLFWLATVGGALATFFGERFQALAAHARDLGLSYASAHLVHLGLVVWVYYYAIVHGMEEPARSTLIFFGIAVFWTYLIALLSFKPVAARLNARTCRILRSIGVEYIALAFFVDFFKSPFQDDFGHIASYAPFVVLSVAGPLLRLAAAGKRLTALRRLPVSARSESLHH